MDYLTESCVQYLLGTRSFGDLVPMLVNVRATELADAMCKAREIAENIRENRLLRELF